MGKKPKDRANQEMNRTRIQTSEAKQITAPLNRCNQKVSAPRDTSEGEKRENHSRGEKQNESPQTGQAE